LHAGGRNLVQTPNIPTARERLPTVLDPGELEVELVEQPLEQTRAADGRPDGSPPARRGLDGLDGIEFSQRLYAVEELQEIYASVGMELSRTYHGNGRPREPSASQSRFRRG